MFKEFQGTPQLGSHYQERCQILVQLYAHGRCVPITTKRINWKKKLVNFQKKKIVNFQKNETGHVILPDDFQIIQSINASDLKTAESISNLWMDIIHS